MWDGSVRGGATSSRKSSEGLEISSIPMLVRFRSPPETPLRAPPRAMKVSTSSELCHKLYVLCMCCIQMHSLRRRRGLPPGADVERAHRRVWSGVPISVSAHFPSRTSWIT